MADERAINKQYYTERNLEKILDNLDAFRKSIFPPSASGEKNKVSEFPSVCLIGLGRCGSNIALDVATMVYRAKTAYFDAMEARAQDQHKSDYAPLAWIRNSFKTEAEKGTTPVFLIEPIVVVGDLDKDIVGRIRYSSGIEDTRFLSEYSKLVILDLSEVHAGGAGNAPILGQYLAKTILNRNTESFTDAAWKRNHAYLIDSCGIKANQSRLYFYIFSAGGGTGSGMASEFGLAQQYAYMSKTLDQIKTDTTGENSRQSFIFEPIFTCGICILPNITSKKKEEVSEALHINAGRLLCKYLSEEWDFSYSDENEKPEDVMPPSIRPWNSMMLISNDIMKYVDESGGDESDIRNVDVNTMEKHANQYISQQIFNILTAQAVTADYDENYFHSAGIDIGETVRLDANDLFMSLAGPTAVAYAESVVPPLQSKADIDMDDLFFRSIDLPHFNKETQTIEGISILPIASDRYRTALKNYQEGKFDASQLNDLHFFQNCSSTVTIISMPKDFKLPYSNLNRLKLHLNNLFPNTTLKRYALVIGTSANLSLTTIIAKSPCLSDECITLLVAYIKRCFANEGHRFTDDLDKAMLDFIQDETLDESLIDEYLNEYENPAKILDTNWYAIKPMYEKKYRELIKDDNKFISINEIRLNTMNVKKAIRYLREVYRHRITKTRVISLNAVRVA
ncbi:MAG: hypothetical protein Q7U07_05135 [Gammaproteobacteria bacterium]|nr:hypothetical protein [Gammaproteobacteria bacterium]